MSALSDLIDLFSKLPGLGPRSARRIVLYLLKNKERIIPNITEMLENLKTSAIFCQICGNIDTSSPCGICSEKNRKSEKVATAFRNPAMNFPEPLITIWESSSYEVLKNALENGQISLRKVLAAADIELLEPPFWEK